MYLIELAIVGVAYFVLASGGGLRDAAGIVVVAPAVILWATTNVRTLNLDSVLAAGIAFVAAILVGLLAFSPVVEQTANRSALAFLAILPLMWAALRCG